MSLPGHCTSYVPAVTLEIVYKPMQLTHRPCITVQVVRGSSPLKETQQVCAFVEPKMIESPRGAGTAAVTQPEAIHPS